MVEQKTEGVCESPRAMVASNPDHDVYRLVFLGCRKFFLSSFKAVMFWDFLSHAAKTNPMRAGQRQALERQSHLGNSHSILSTVNGDGLHNVILKCTKAFEDPDSHCSCMCSPPPHVLWILPCKCVSNQVPCDWLCDAIFIWSVLPNSRLRNCRRQSGNYLNNLDEGRS